MYLQLTDEVWVTDADLLSALDGFAAAGCMNFVIVFMELRVWRPKEVFRRIRRRSGIYLLLADRFSIFSSFTQLVCSAD